jgi:hypothetical protein
MWENNSSYRNITYSKRSNIFLKSYERPWSHKPHLLICLFHIINYQLSKEGRTQCTVAKVSHYSCHDPRKPSTSSYNMGQEIRKGCRRNTGRWKGGKCTKGTEEWKNRDERIILTWRGGGRKGERNEWMMDKRWERNMERRGIKAQIRWSKGRKKLFPPSSWQHTY